MSTGMGTSNVGPSRQHENGMSAIAVTESAPV
jgi:hypothetical protein